MQYLKCVGGGPSGKTWPRWLPQRLQCTSVRRMKNAVSVDSPIEPSMGTLKLGQPVPLSNLRSATNSGWPQAAQLKVPARCSWSRAQVPARSVPCSRMTWYCSGVRSARHSASVLVTGYVSVASFIVPILPEAGSLVGGLAGDLEDVCGGQDDRQQPHRLRAAHHREHARPARIDLAKRQQADQ